MIMGLNPGAGPETPFTPQASGECDPKANHGYEPRGKSWPLLAAASGVEFDPQAIRTYHKAPP